jgi:putative selenium metabolism hydrolase
MRPGGVVIGESTNLDVALGHRGSMAIKITTEGVSCHASVPERGINALYKMIPILQGIVQEADSLPSHLVLGKSSMVATTISVNPNVKNVVPNLCSIAVDVRNTTDFPVDDVISTLQGVVMQAKSRDSEIKAKVELAKRNLRSYTGYAEEIDAMTPPFYSEPSTPLAQMTRNAVTRVLGREAKFKVWNFATDGSYFTERGIPTVGFGPSEERFAHSRDDNVSIEHLVESAKVYAVLAAEFCQ